MELSIIARPAAVFPAHPPIHRYSFSILHNIPLAGQISVIFTWSTIRLPATAIPFLISSPPLKPSIFIMILKIHVLRGALGAYLDVYFMSAA